MANIHGMFTSPITLAVTAETIECAQRRSAARCPLALALARDTGLETGTSFNSLGELVSRARPQGQDALDEFEAIIPADIAERLLAYDADKPLEPFVAILEYRCTRRGLEFFDDELPKLSARLLVLLTHLASASGLSIAPENVDLLATGTPKNLEAARAALCEIADLATGAVN